MLGKPRVGGGVGGEAVVREGRLGGGAEGAGGRQGLVGTRFASRPVYNRKKKWAALRAQPNARHALRDEHAEIRIVETQEPLSDMYVLMSPLKRKK